MPSFGFDRALLALDRVNGFVTATRGNEIFEIGPATMRVVPHVSKVINKFSVPTIDYKSFGKS